MVPCFLEHNDRQAMADGSIRTEHPKELAEAMIILADMWINPIVQPTTPEEIRARCEIYSRLFQGFGVDGLIDQEIVSTLVQYAEMAHPPSSGGETQG